MKNNRVYVDTSVFGGVFDSEFEKPSKKFFEQVKLRQFIVVSSIVVIDEIAPAPKHVRKLFNEMQPYIEFVRISDEALTLRAAYLRANIVSKKYSDDALHVALATVSGCPTIVSWNFKHIVHHDKIPLYNAVNILQRYNQISIFTPPEVIHYEEDV